MTIDRLHGDNYPLAINIRCRCYRLFATTIDSFFRSVPARARHGLVGFVHSTGCSRDRVWLNDHPFEWKGTCVVGWLRCERVVRRCLHHWWLAFGTRFFSVSFILLGSSIRVGLWRKHRYLQGKIPESGSSKNSETSCICRGFHSDYYAIFVCCQNSL